MRFRKRHCFLHLLALAMLFVGLLSACRVDPPSGGNPSGPVPSSPTRQARSATDRPTRAPSLGTAGATPVPTGGTTGLPPMPTREDVAFVLNILHTSLVQGEVQPCG